MDTIFEANKDFDFSRLSLAQPTSTQGGAYFTKIQYNEKPLYIETPKSFTKQGFLKNGKKMFVDLMFDGSAMNEDFVQWIEHLETRCQELIYEKGDTWFQNKLEMNDIEGAFTSPLKIYKSGKFYLLRVNVKMNYSTNNPYIRIYNEAEVPLSIDDVTAETNIISIIEVQGIKFTSRNFQIDIEVKQMMVLNTYEIFESCLIKKVGTKKSAVEETKPNVSLEINEDKTIDYADPIEQKEFSLEKEDKKEEQDKKQEDKEEDKKEQKGGEENTTMNPIDLLDLEMPEDDDLKEINIDTSNDGLETIQLKKPNQVYYEIYKEARRKAKQAKKEAIVAFLEAKNIKKTYLLEDLEDSEDSENSDMDNLSDEEYEEYE